MGMREGGRGLINSFLEPVSGELTLVHHCIFSFVTKR